MKVCPACQKRYDDNDLQFCLNDGSPLRYAEPEAETIVSSRSAGQAPPTVAFPPPPATQAVPARKSRIGLIIVAIIAVFFLGLLAVGVIGGIFYFSMGDKKNNVANNPPSPTPATTATPDAEKEKMKDQLANMQKQLDRQKNSNPGNSTQIPNYPEPGSVQAHANSPSDGFLALRSEPDSERGSRVTKIPHGALIEISKCGPYTTTARGNYGRWCQATYDGYSGWVFDAFVRY